MDTNISSIRTETASLSAPSPVFRLCYVEGCWAHFSTLPVERQWGDDWNDAPYEHNAGAPYSWKESDRAHGIEPYSVCKVAWEGPFDTPCDWTSNSGYSVEAINKGCVPWLAPARYNGRRHDVSIYAGTTLDDFRALVKSVGGGLWEPAW